MKLNSVADYKEFKDDCPDCHGTGKLPEDKYKRKVLLSNSGLSCREIIDCVKYNICPTCGGTGFIVWKE